MATLAATATTYSVGSLTVNTNYSFRISAFVGGLTSGYAAANVATPVPAPPTPAGFTATLNNSTVNLTWTDGALESGYVLQRAVNGSGFTVLANLPANTTAYADSTLTAGSTAQYKIQAGNPTGNSPLSSPVSVTIPALPPPLTGVVADGTGLRGVYFDNMTLTTDANTLSRVDIALNFDWGINPPAAGFPRTQFSARWTGQILAKTSETYTFYTVSDDGARLWVNAQLLIDNWKDHAPQTNPGAITLMAGQKVDIKLEYYQNGGGGANLQLDWSAPSFLPAPECPRRLPVPRS